MFTVIPAGGKAAFGQSERRLIEWRDREPNQELSVDGEKREPVAAGHRGGGGGRAPGARCGTRYVIRPRSGLQT
jgi:hypothetical protein